jgi:hypothetical protein
MEVLMEKKKDILRLLERGDRTDISGNRMTSVGFGLGAGALNYWNGEWMGVGAGGAYGQEALALDVLTDQGESLFPQLMNLIWRPDRLTMWYATSKLLEIVETKTIFQDVFVDRIVFSYSNNHNTARVPLDIHAIVRGHQMDECDLSFEDGRLIVHNKERDTWLVIGVVGDTDLRPVEVGGQDYRLGFSHHFEGFTVETIHEERFPVYLLCAGDDTPEKAHEKFSLVAQDPEQAFARRTAEWTDYFESQVPHLETSDRLLQKLFYHSFFVSFANLYDFGKKGFFQETFSSLSKFRLQPLWYWDTFFHGLYEKWLNGAVVPESSLRNLVLYESVEEMKGKVHENHQGPKPFVTPTNGQLPFTLTISSFTTGPLIDPHIIPIGILDIFLKKGDLDFVKSMIPALAKYDEYLMKNRDPNGDNLINMIHSGENWDNSKRWIQDPCFKYAASPLQNEGTFMQVPDFNTYFYTSRLALAMFCELSGDTGAAAEFRSRAKLTKKAIETMWDDDIGLYMDRYEEGRVPTTVKTFGGMITMLGGIATPEQAERMVAHLSNPNEFWSDYPVPTLSMDDPDFNAEDEYQSYWNGRVWPNMNWVLIESLIRYGYHDVAQSLAEKTLGMMVASGEPTCRENYSPFYKDRGHYRKQNHNTFNYGWGGLGADIMLRRFLGVQGYASADRLYLDPYFPASLTHAHVEHIAIGSHTIGLSIRREKEGTLDCELAHSGPRPLTVEHNQGHATVENNSLALKIEDGKHLDFNWIGILG